MTNDTKMIRIVSRGYVSTSRGRVMTPIISPYRESVNRIWNMLTVDRADIDEKLDDGTFVRLTIHNYDKDNSVKVDVATGVPHKVVAPVEPEPVKVEEPKVEEVVPEVVEEESVAENTEEPNYSNNSKKNRKRNRNRQSSNNEPAEESTVVEPKEEEKTEGESIAVEAEEVQ